MSDEDKAIEEALRGVHKTAAKLGGSLGKIADGPKEKEIVTTDVDSLYINGTKLERAILQKEFPGRKWPAVKDR